jgi:hypothetical protein
MSLKSYTYRIRSSQLLCDYFCVAVHANDIDNMSVALVARGLARGVADSFKGIRSIVIMATKQSRTDATRPRQSSRYSSDHRA